MRLAHFCLWHFSTDPAYAICVRFWGVADIDGAASAASVENDPELT